MFIIINMHFVVINIKSENANIKMDALRLNWFSVIISVNTLFYCIIKTA
jgi:hypothetical protein